MKAGIFDPHEFRDMDEAKARNLMIKGLSEMFGTGLFVCLGCMSGLSDYRGDFLDDLSRAISFSFAIAMSVMIFGHISCIINPALTVADVIRGEKSIFMFIYFVIMQCLGAFFGYTILRLLVPNEVLGRRDAQLSFCCTVKHEQMSSLQGVGVEMITTGGLCLLYCSLQDPKNSDRNQTVALKFGIALLALMLPCGHYANVSGNPARAFGPALYNNNWDYHWINWVGPMAGAVVASLLYGFIFAQYSSRSGSTSSTARSLP